MLEYTQQQHWPVRLVWWVWIAMFMSAELNKTTCRCTKYNECYFLLFFLVDPSVLSDTLVAHTDAVWGLSIHSSKMQLLSCSADGTVRLWSPGSKSPLLNTFRAEDGKLLSYCLNLLRRDAWNVWKTVCLCIIMGLFILYWVLTEILSFVEEGVPTSIDFIRCEPSHMVASYNSCNTYIYDIETAKQVIALESNQTSGT